MSDKKFTVPGGGSFDLTLKRKKKPAPKRADSGQSHSGLVGADDERSRYVFRGQIGITFFDLGTRYRDGAYSYQMHASPSSLGAPDYSLYLADDPLGTTSGHPNCLKLPYASEYLYLDAVLKKAGEDDLRYVVGRNNTRAFVKDLPGPPVDDPKPAWKSPGTLAPKGAGAGRALAVEAAVYYASFDTSDTAACKVTRLPNPSADAAPFTIPASGRLRVFLRPSRTIDFLYENFFHADLGGMGRLPVLPDFSLQATLLTGQTEGFGQFSATASPGLSAAVRALYSTLPPAQPDEIDNPPFTLAEAQYISGQTFSLVETETDAITLLAIIDAGKGEVFYVWQAAGGDRLPWETFSLGLV